MTKGGRSGRVRGAIGGAVAGARRAGGCLGLVAAGLLALAGAPARAQTGGAPFNTTSPTPNPMGIPDPTQPPPAESPTSGAMPTTATPGPVPPAEPAPGAGTATVPPPVLPESETTPAAPPVPTPVVPAPPITPAAPTTVVPPPANAPPPPPVNINPAPQAPPPLRRSPDANAVAIPGATVERIPVQPMPAINTDHGTMYWPGLSDIGWAVQVGGGYEDFTNGNMRGFSTGGGSWAVRLVGGTQSILGFEAAYVGSARGITGLGLVGNSSTLVSNGLEATLRINVPVIRGWSLYEPYGFIGLGWSRYSITNYNATVTSDLASGDDVMTMPFGVGFAYGYRAFIVDARASYVPTYYNNLLQTANGSGGLNHWGIGGQVGFVF